MNKYNISPSLIKDYKRVDYGAMCGQLFREKHILKTLEFETSDAMLAGQYFEYIATGQTPRDGSVPKPVTLKNGDLNTQYERIHSQAELFKKWCVSAKITDIQTGVLIQVEHNGYNVKGITDIICKVDGVPTIIDTKLSGLLDNKWKNASLEAITLIISLLIINYTLNNIKYLNY